MKDTALFLLILFVILLVACQAEAPIPTKVVTAVPIEEASPEAQEETEAPEPTMVATAIPTVETASANVLPRVEPLAECFVEMPEGADYECQRVEVPEFHHEENGRSIKLGVIRLLSTADTPAEPLFFAEGGPGGSNIYQAPAIAQMMLAGEESVYTDLLSTRDLVFFTQRGTLYAEPALMCSDESVGPYLEAFFIASAQERAQAEIDAYKTCYEEYAAAGVDFTAYNSVENAADINSIREVLGYDQIVMYGDSYGTLLVQHVMRDYPDTLTAVIMDGTVPISSPTWDSQLDARYQLALEYVIGLCAADEACSEAYPNLPEDMEAVYQKLQTEPNLIDLGETQFLLDENLAAWAFHDAFLSPLTAPILPLAVDSLLNGEQDERTFFLFYQIVPRFDSISLPMHFAVVCSEAPITSVDDAISLEEEVYSVVSDYVQSDTFRYKEMCSYMNLPVLPEEMKAPISSDVPVLLLSGSFDTATPPFNAEEILATLPNGISLEFPYGGHVQFLSEDPCAESIVASFIADPTTEPDGSCIAEALPLPFALPAEQ